MSERKVTIVEVGPRDGLQNEKTFLATSFKVELITRLEKCGFKEVEVTSMVSPKWVSQLGDAAQVLETMKDISHENARTVLVPNFKGLERALDAGVQRVAVFVAASETFSSKNTNRSILKSMQDTEPVVARALELGLSVRGYLSTAFVCPFEGSIEPKIVADLTRELLKMGCDQISLGDTIGAAVPEDISRLLALLEDVPQEKLALHLHNTYGTALANVTRGLELGIRTFDSSVGGAGGCPYAPGASGNLATEDLVYMLERGGWEHGIDLKMLIETANFLASGLGRGLESHLSEIDLDKISWLSLQAR